MQSVFEHFWLVLPPILYSSPDWWLPCKEMSTWGNEQTYQSTVDNDALAQSILRGGPEEEMESTDKARYNPLSKIWLRADNSPRQIMRCTVKVKSVAS